MVTEKEDVLNKAWHLKWDGLSFGNSKVWMVLVLTLRDRQYSGEGGSGLHQSKALP